MVLLHGTLDVHIHEANDLPLSLSNQVCLPMELLHLCFDLSMDHTLAAGSAGQLHTASVGSLACMQHPALHYKACLELCGILMSNVCSCPQAHLPKSCVRVMP